MRNNFRRRTKVAKLGLMGFIIALLLLVGYIMNLVKFIQCDFKAPYKAEVIHGIGLSGLGVVIGWINIDDTPETPAPAE